MALVTLPNGCYRSQIKVIPGNWKTQKAHIKKAWRIYYRFYDPAFKGTNLWGYFVPIKGMNAFKTLAERQDITAGLIASEEQRLKEGYNPITTKTVKVKTNETGIKLVSPSTLFMEALRLAEPRLDTVQEVREDIQRIIKSLEAAGEKLYDEDLHRRFTEIPIYQVETKHLIYLFDQCRLDNPKFSAKRENRYKANLSMCFNMLKKLGVINTNPTEAIDKKKVSVATRAILSEDEAKLVDETLFKKDYYFWRYMQIFFHSGARNTEMLQLQKDHRVNLVKQEFTVLQKKGGDYIDVTKPIPTEVLHLWKELWNEAEAGQFLIGRAFKPGPKPSHEDWPSRKWKEMVKDPAQPDGTGGLGINKDWYALKHRRSDMLAEKLSLQHAQLADSHTSERTTLIYAVNEAEREKARKLEQIKSVQLSFSQS